jgi:uncharacterized protein (DUF2236 family)
MHQVKQRQALADTKGCAVATAPTRPFYAIGRATAAAPEPGRDDTRGVAQKINGEIVVLLGWGPAILLQFAHPLVAAGVAQHSTFSAAARGRMYRLHHTVHAMLALTFGTPVQAARAAGRINAIHDRVHGSLHEPTPVFPQGFPYSAHDPALLRWVHATMLYMLPRTYELYVGPLTPEEKDRYCAEASTIAPLLGIPTGYLPTSTSALRSYMDEMLAGGTIAVTAPARVLARELVYPPFPRAARPLLWLIQLATIGLLPPAIRKAYGFGWSPWQEAALHLSARLVRGVLPLVPPAFRYWPVARRRR